MLLIVHLMIKSVHKDENVFLYKVFKVCSYIYFAKKITRLTQFELIKNINVCDSICKLIASYITERQAYITLPYTLMANFFEKRDLIEKTTSKNYCTNTANILSSSCIN